MVLAAIVIVGVGIFFRPAKKSSENQAETPIKVGIVPYPGFGTFYVAEEKGLFKKYGVSVELVPLSLDSMVPALESNRVQMLVGSADFMPIIADAGIEAKTIFSTSRSYGADGLVVTKDIQKMTDLKSKKVYAAYGFPDHFFFRYLAQKNGLAHGDVELVNLNSEEVGSSFVAGEIKAGMTWEPWLSKAKTRPDGQVLISSRDEPGIIIDTVLARNDVVTNHRDQVKHLMQAFFEGVDWWNTHTEEGNKIVARHFNLSPEEFAPMRETVWLSDLRTSRQLFDRSVSRNVYEMSAAAADIYLADGVIKTKPTVESMVDASLLNELKP